MKIQSNGWIDDVIAVTMKSSGTIDSTTISSSGSGPACRWDVSRDDRRKVNVLFWSFEWAAYVMLETL